MGREYSQMSPDSGKSLRQDNSVFHRSDFWTDKETQFGQLSVVERTPRIELKSAFGLSALRDIITTSTSTGAAVTSTGGEFRLTTPAESTASATLDSAERGQYIPGTVAEAGLGIRSPATPSSNQEFLWGYGDDNDGMFFGEDADGFFVRRRRAGVDTTFRTSEFNGDSIPGGSISSSNGYIFQAEVAWYGFGVLRWVYFVDDENTRSKKIVLHREKVDGQTSLENPNLPIRAQVTNNGTASSGELFVAGRQFAIIGRSRPNERINGEFRNLTGIGTTFVPVMAFRKSTAFRNVPVRLRRLDAVTQGGEDLRFQLRLDTNLTNASFGSLADTSTDETSLQVDTSATAASSGEIVGKGLLQAGGKKESNLSDSDLLSQVMPPGENITLLTRTVSTAGSTGELSATLTFQEEF